MTRQPPGAAPAPPCVQRQARRAPVMGAACAGKQRDAAQGAPRPPPGAAPAPPCVQRHAPRTCHAWRCRTGAARWPRPALRSPWTAWPPSAPPPASCAWVKRQRRRCLGIVLHTALHMAFQTASILAPSRIFQPITRTVTMDRLSAMKSCLMSVVFHRHRSVSMSSHLRRAQTITQRRGRLACSSVPLRCSTATARTSAPA